MVDIVHVTIEVLSGPIASSIHITNCHNCQLKAVGSAQQLRIHESTGLRFQVPLVAGAILEESKDIVFLFDGSNTDADVKDFNWLRTGVPSPNYRIESANEEMRPQVEDEQFPISPVHSNTIPAATGSDSPSEDDLPPSGAVETSRPEEPDSDDEL